MKLKLLKSRLATVFTAENRQRIAEAVASAEQQTSGEIRVKVIPDCDPDCNGDIWTQALREFEKEGLGNTKEKTGVLLLIAFEAKKFCVLGDEGIYRRVGQNYFNNISGMLTVCFIRGNFVEGICSAVLQIGEQLARYFPKQANDVNELPNQPIIEGV